MKPLPLAALALLVGSGCSPREGGSAPAHAVAQYTIDQFYDNTSFRGLSLSHDASKVLVSSDKSGIYNAYAVPAAGGEPQRLTNSSSDAIFALSYFPADDRVLFARDSGGNELTHIWVRNQDGSTRDLTPGKKLKAQFLGWAADDKSFFYGSNQRDPKFFDVYEMTVDNFRPALVYKNTKGLDVGAISRDKRWFALSKPNTTSDADIYLLDRKSGAMKLVTPHTGDILVQPIDFTPDGSALVFASDSGREFRGLRSYDLSKGTSAPLLQLDWDIVGGGFTHDGRYLVVSLDENSTPRYKVYDARTMAPVALPGFPDMAVVDMTFGLGDSTYALLATPGDAPLDVYIGSTGAAPRRIATGLNPQIVRADLVVPKVVTFKSYDSLAIPGVLYLPHQASSSAKAPGLVLVHGGPGGQATVHYSALAQFLVNHGYVVFDINNRGSSGYGKSFDKMDDRKHGEADLGDIVASKRMLVATGVVDSAKIGIIGGSYGGYMVLAALTLQPDAFKAGVDLFGISNWVRTLNSIPPWWESFRKALYAEMGDPKTDSARLYRISPLFNADKIKAPLMVLQGANDPRVLQRESDEIVAAAKKNGVPVEYIVFPDEGHGFVKKENEKKGYQAVLVFLDKYLKGAAPTSAN